MADGGEPSTSPATTGTEDQDLSTRVEQAVRKVLGGLLGSGEMSIDDQATRTPEPEKRPTRADEEDQMRALVAAAVRQLKSEQPDPPKAPEKPAPETTPRSAVRRVEKLMGWS